MNGGDTLEYIKGKYKSSIFDGNNGYKVGLFRVKEASEGLEDLINKTITFTGYFHELNGEDVYIFNGNYIMHERFGEQFQVSSYERVEPEGADAIIEFLSSSFVKGCGEKTAQKIVDVLGDDAIKLIKEDKNNLYKVGLTPRQTENIYTSIMNYYDSDETIIYLKSLGFSVKEITTLLNLYGNKIRNIIDTDIYTLIDYVPFDKLDSIYFKLYDETKDIRIYACLVETLKRLSFSNGDTFSYKAEIYDFMLNVFNIDLYDQMDEYISKLVYRGIIKICDERYYLMENYQDEQAIVRLLNLIKSHNRPLTRNVDNIVEAIQKEQALSYNKEQISAMKTALSNSVTIITGGPGTGKTTLINGLLRLYQEMSDITDTNMPNKVALLAPTGRASKRMSETTNFKASTIHRYLKWNHETNEFGVNEYNPNPQDLIIVDEVSMIDTSLLANLLRGISSMAKIVFVGDENQLPSVGAGNVLKDLIDSNEFPHIRLTSIYRQSENSFIPILASEIKNGDLTSNFEEKRDDYNFLKCDRLHIKSMLKEIVSRSLEHGLDKKDIQVLAPMYKGENGIDNLNVILQEILNPASYNLDEVHIGKIIYRVNDKVINLLNNIDENIFNGDIGYIVDVNPKKNSEFMTVDFYGNWVTFKREEVGQLRHAYAMSIHKSQGSEFNHVIMPITKEYNKMLYNKLLYTGVSRAKKSLVIIGSPEAFEYAVNNNYSIERKTSLKEFLMHKNT